MKSVFTTFSQITGNVLSKACLVVLCVFVFSSMGSAQSFTDVRDAHVKLRSAISDMKGGNQESVGTVKVKTQNELGQTEIDYVSPAQQVDEQLRRSYYSLLLKYVPNQNFNGAVGTAIEEAHARMVGRNPDSITQLIAFKQEVTDFLSN